MCGRYTLATPADGLIEAFDVPTPTFDLVPRFNIAPGQQAPVVAEDRHGRRMGLLTWGFIPAARARPGNGLVNARAESVGERPSFAKAFRRRRCLVPADGFYEWKRVEATSTHRGRNSGIPFWIHPVGAGPVSFGGIWESWHGPTDEVRHTFAILTTEASADVRPIHDRMPLVIAEVDRHEWLHRETSPDRLARLLRPAPEGTFASHRVDVRVNRTSQDDAALIDPVT